MDEFPKTYDVPRNGEVVAVSVRDRDDVRAVRTELELFRCIRRELSTPEATDVYPMPGKYSETDVQDLRGIASDAHYSSLDGLIEQIDREFTGLREEITMASVHEEAERIAHEVAESGAASAKEVSANEDAVAVCDPTPEPVPEAAVETVPEAATEPAAEMASDPVSDDEPEIAAASDLAPDSESDDRSVHEALMEAEAELALAVGVKPEPAQATVADGASNETMPDEAADEMVNEIADTEADADQQPTMEPHVRDAVQAEVAPNPEDGQVEPPAAVIEVFEEGISEVGAAPTQVPSADVKTNEQPDLSPAPVPTNISDSAEPLRKQDANAPWTPDRAERAVGEIEAGIRKLAGVLTTEVNDQWSGAKVALGEIQSIRDQLGQANDQSRQILEELNRVKEQVGIARSETDIARREARLFREDAKRAKERADRSAEAAEHSANSATLELENTVASKSPS